MQLISRKPYELAENNMKDNSRGLSKQFKPIIKPIIHQEMPNNAKKSKEMPQRFSQIWPNLNRTESSAQGSNLCPLCFQNTNLLGIRNFVVRNLDSCCLGTRNFGFFRETPQDCFVSFVWKQKRWPNFMLITLSQISSLCAALQPADLLIMKMLSFRSLT